MSCPFLRETRVRSCRAAGIRKLIVETHAASADERCSSTGFGHCSVYKESAAENAQGSDRCPLLDERHVRYCAASSIPHYVPWSEQEGQCGGAGYQYCDLWLSISRPHAAGHAPKDPTVDGIVVPRGLWYSPNHLWLDAAEGQCHIGIDGFLARTFGSVDAISFVTVGGVHQPSVVLRVRGVDWALVFPSKLMITGTNSYLRHAPERLTADPYGSGWLFEAWPVPPANIDCAGLMRGDQAVAWMKSEVERQGEFIHHLDPSTLNDGGRPADDFIRHLPREQVLRLLHAFFASHVGFGGSI